MLNWLRKAAEPADEIPGITDLNGPFEMDQAILFKHSTKCPLSFNAYREVSRFRKEFPAVPVFVILVREERPLAVAISEKTGIEHASPQILVLQKGVVQSVISHEQITAEEIADLVSPQLQTQA